MAWTTAAQWMSLLAVAAMLLAQLACINVVDLDTYHEMSLFRAALEIGHIPRHDLFAFTPTVDPSVHHEWGTGMVAYAVSMSLGAEGLTGLKFLTLAGVAGLCVYCARRRGAGWPVFCLLAPVAVETGVVGISTFRAQIFTLLFTALLLVLLDADWRGRRGWLPAWLGAYVLWLNLHAGFVVGLGLVGIHWLEGVIRRQGMQWRLLAGLAAMLGLVLVNPYGADYPRYLWRGLFMPRPLIAEWVPLWQDPMLLASFLVALMVTAYALWKNGWTNSRGLLIVLVCAAAAARHMRHSSLFAVAWISYVPGWMQQTPLGGKIDEFWRRRARLVTAVFAVLAIFCLGLTIYKKPWHLRVPAMQKERFGSLMYPVGAVEYLRQQQFSGKVMTPYGAGSFVSWKLYPAVKVGLDSRYEVAYQSGVMEAICEMYDGKPTWRETLQKYRPDLVLAEGRSRLAGLLDKDPQWKCVYRDDAYSLYAWPQTQLPTVDRKGQELVGKFP